MGYLQCDNSVPGEKVVEVLKTIINDRGRPEQIRMDNGPELSKFDIV